MAHCTLIDTCLDHEPAFKYTTAIQQLLVKWLQIECSKLRGWAWCPEKKRPGPRFWCKIVAPLNAPLKAPLKTSLKKLLLKYSKKLSKEHSKEQIFALESGPSSLHVHDLVTLRCDRCEHGALSVFPPRSHFERQMCTANHLEPGRWQPPPPGKIMARKRCTFV